jgi:ankyrin repeat protein
MNNDNDAILFTAITNNDITIASSLIASGSIVCLPSRLLSLAAMHGRVEIMAMLLDAGADIDAVDEWQKTACHVAIKYGRLAALELLVGRGANLGVLDDKKASLFAYATSQPNDRFSIVLLDAGAPLGRLSPDQLMRAATKSAALVARLVARDVDLSVVRDSTGRTPCHVAASSRSEHAEALMRALVDDARVDIDARDAFGSTPCHSVAYRANKDALGLLIELGADVDRPNRRGLTVLQSLCARDDEKYVPCVILLLAAGADHRLVTEPGETADVVRIVLDGILCALLAAGADFDKRDSRERKLRQNVASVCRWPSVDDIDNARRRIARRRLDFVRRRAVEVCLGLRPLNLDALQMCEILLHSCGPVAPVVAFHQWWKIATAFKHFRRKT